MTIGSRRQKYRALLVGAGRIGLTLAFDRLREQPASHARALAGHPRIALVGAVDLEPKKLDVFRKVYPNTSVFLDLNEAMKREQPDLVVIAVPEEAHAPVAASVFARRPRLVVLEKPVAPHPAEAESIRRAAKRFGVPVLVNHERRFAADYALARSLLADGALGTIDAVYARLWSGAPVWRTGAERDGACSLLHDATHLLDTMRFLLQKDLPDPHIDFLHKRKDGTVRRLCLHYTLSGGVFAAVEIAGNKRVFEFTIEVCGDAGRLVIGNGCLKLWKRAPSPYYSGFYSLVRDRRVKRPANTGYLSRMVQHCVDFLDGKTPLASPLSEGIKTLTDLWRIVVRL